MPKKIRDEIKAIFFDIDGTYFDHEKNRVLPSTIKAMKKLKENEYKIALCSGRPLLMAKELDVFNHVEWDGFIGSAGNTAVSYTHLDVYKRQLLVQSQWQEILLQLI